MVNILKQCMKAYNRGFYIIYVCESVPILIKALVVQLCTGLLIALKSDGYSQAVRTYVC